MLMLLLGTSALLAFAWAVKLVKDTEVRQFEDWCDLNLARALVVEAEHQALAAEEANEEARALLAMAATLESNVYLD